MRYRFQTVIFICVAVADRLTVGKSLRNRCDRIGVAVVGIVRHSSLFIGIFCERTLILVIQIAFGIAVLIRSLRNICAVRCVRCTRFNNERITLDLERGRVTHTVICVKILCAALARRRGHIVPAVMLIIISKALGINGFGEIAV